MSLSLSNLWLLRLALTSDYNLECRLLAYSRLFLLGPEEGLIPELYLI